MSMSKMSGSSSTKKGPNSSNDNDPGHGYPFNVYELQKEDCTLLVRCNGYTDDIMLVDIKKFAEELNARPKDVTGFYVTPFEIPKEVKDFVKSYERNIIFSNQTELTKKINDQLEIVKKNKRENALKQLEEMGCKDLNIVNVKYL
ncbi:1163_t:CDS:1 [Gigaspora margarita]|uniref:Uncharacterized protein n=2 Tax=Gigaspora margarita TaxID=4874 RepID=A0A8H4A3P2_GIGMA|nr:hypothetical protein F8M41_006590 [Gigaspora margarita]CAG8508693.1 1163_t:CDS:1 [Gigaspora margarita]